jgi:mRNA interferase RelE/StbE
MSQIVIHRRSARYLERLSGIDQDRIQKALQRLAAEPDAYPGLLQMAGEWAGYQRIQIGDFRVIFWYDHDEDIIYVDHIGPRGDIYK